MLGVIIALNPFSCHSAGIFLIISDRTGTEMGDMIYCLKKQTLSITLLEKSKANMEIFLNQVFFKVFLCTLSKIK